jgi:hypothetical protein
MNSVPNFLLKTFNRLLKLNRLRITVVLVLAHNPSVYKTENELKELLEAAFPHLVLL